MKWNWGTGIAAFYSLFVIVLVSIVIKASSWGVPLVQDEYYQADINYENFRTTRVNASQLEELPKIIMSPASQQIVVQFPEKVVIQEGQVQLYRPSRSDIDQIEEISLNANNQMFLSSKDLLKGKWRLKINWTDNDRPYFLEEEIYI